VCVVAGAALVAMGVDVAAGHAAGDHSARGAVIAAQWAHFAAVGVWLGGLAALLFHVRGAGSEEKAASVRRFSRLALVALLVVVVTGVIRALGELSSWGDLTSTGYGRAVLLKAVLIIAIVTLAAANRWWSVPVAATNPRRLRMVSGAEILLAVGALAAAAVLASLAPPVSARAGESTGLAVSGADAATSTRVTLTTLSASSGPNAFAVRAVDYDTGAPLSADHVTLRFLPVDDPGAAPTTLELRAGAAESWVGSGANLSFDGRWRVSTILERGDASVVVPLELQVRSAPQFVSVERIPGQPIRYTVELAAGGYARVWAQPQRSGPNAIHAAFFDRNGDPRPVDNAVVVVTSAGGSSRQRLAKAVGPGQFVADVNLPAGRSAVAVIAQAAEGARLRASVDLDVSGGP
jgi:uncharacterized membrane protein